MTSTEIRDQFLSFFESKQHKIVPSAPIVNTDDPSLMFVNAGMNPFKDLFLGNQAIQDPRVADTQRCLRVSGKHNDIEDVGVDSYHHTMFEMLGNWSFGDYFKKEAIAWAWELLVDVYGLDPNRLYATYFEGDTEDQLEADDEAAELWSQYLPADHILACDKKDNFWEMGETGPCGPCSEIHIDLRSDEDRAQLSGAKLVNQDHPLVIEIWNLVFIQFNRKADRSLESLEKSHVDTGMGFERLVMALQGKKSNYDTDVFSPIIDFIEKSLGVRYRGSYDPSAKSDIAMRVLADHSRAVAFAIADGCLPSNTGAGYVIRRILRRATRYYYSYLNRDTPFLHLIVGEWIKYYKPIFPELKEQEGFIKQIIEEEEKSFIRTIDRGLKRLEQIKPEKGVIRGEDAFELYDTYGFPLDLIQLVAAEDDLTVDEEGFNEELNKQRERARAAGQKSVDDWQLIHPERDQQFVGYDQLVVEGTQIIKFRKVKTQSGESYEIVLADTPLYAEGGGQVGDTGFIKVGEQTIEISDTVRDNKLFVCIASEVPRQPDASVRAEVHGVRRRDIEKNHSATHLVHAALRTVLGDHVEQRGSLVTDGYLRFDFSHFSKATDEQIVEVEQIVNQKIRENVALLEHRSIPIDEAQAAGAMMLFGEKYGDSVRMITFDPEYSRELCGGCHVSATGEIGYFRIISESSVAAGIRRIEAITGKAAEEKTRSELNELRTLQSLMHNPKDAEQHLKQVLEESKKLQKEIARMQRDQAGDLKGDLVKSASDYQGIKLIVSTVELPDPKMLKGLTFELQKAITPGVVILGAQSDGKAQIMISRDQIDRLDTIHAGKIVKDSAQHIRGGGGGQAFFASAGGSHPDGLQAAIEHARELVIKEIV